MGLFEKLLPELLLLGFCPEVTGENETRKEYAKRRNELSDCAKSAVEGRNSKKLNGLNEMIGLEEYEETNTDRARP